MEGILSDKDFVRQYVNSAQPTCSKTEEAAFHVTRSSHLTDLEPFDDQGLRELIESQILVCAAPPRTLKGPSNQEATVAACSDCAYGWARTEDQGPLTCKPGPLCAGKAADCKTCEMDPLHWFVRGPCDACIGEPVCHDGRCSCQW